MNELVLFLRTRAPGRLRSLYRVFERAIFPHGQEAVGEFLDMSPGFFVEVGANEPKNGSQTWHLEQQGWTGILIEPQPHLAERLRRERSAVVHAVACSSPANSGRELPLHIAGPESSLNKGWTLSDNTILVPIRTLDEILTEAGAPSPIDFLSIDVEGHALEVLAGMNLIRWQPRLILIEDHVTNLALHRELVRNGYHWFRRTGLNSWYVPCSRSVGFYGRLQFLRKYYLGTPIRNARDVLRRFRRTIRQQI